jgi:hypothetical protein
VRGALERLASEEKRRENTERVVCSQRANQLVAATRANSYSFRECFKLNLPRYPVFLRKSAETHEKKGVELRSLAKERKRVRKDMKIKGIVRISGERCSG